MANSENFIPIYPDVLRTITQGPRVNMEALECIIGVYPAVAYINQPIEVVLVLQSMVDDDLHLKIAMRTPTTDRRGNVVVVDTARPQVGLTLRPGEVGVFRMPIIARPPTRPAKDFPVRVAIRYRTNATQAVRPPGGGAPPSVLSVSPFKLQVLRDVDFVAHKWNESTDILTVNFDLAAKHMPGTPEMPKPHYETLWAQEEWEKEVRLARSRYDDALEIAKPGATGGLYISMLDAVEERFAARGMPLHPGEAMAIAKMMTYTVEDAPGREPDVVLEETRWFRSLCQVLAHNPSLLELDRADILSKYVFESVLHDSIGVAFGILEGRVEENLGDRVERRNYARRIMKWFAGAGEGDLAYVYLPLVLGGLSIARLVRSSYAENPWDIADELSEAYNGRVRLVTGEASTIFDMLINLLARYQRVLKSQRIERPYRRTREG
jgi:hypothetical protein